MVLPLAVGAARMKDVGRSGNGSPKGHGTVSAAPPNTCIWFPCGFGAIYLAQVSESSPSCSSQLYDRLRDPVEQASGTARS